MLRKKKIWTWIKNHKLILGILVFYFLIRLPFLDQLNLLHDERDISLSGYSIAKTGKDLSGTFLPLSVKNIAPETPFVSIYFSAFWWLFMNAKSVFLARLPFVLISSFSVLIIYKLIELLTKSRKIALFTSIIACFSPWLFHISRLAFEINIAFPVLLLAIFFQLKKDIKISFLLYFLSFFSYQGFRILIPIVILYVFFFFNSDKGIKKFKSLLPYVIFIFCLLLSVGLIDRDITQKRFNQVVFLNTKYFDSSVIFKRNTSSAPPLIKSIFDNKITESANYVISAFVKGQDFTYLFKDGDYSAINNSISGGQFLLPFIILYYLGFAALGKKLDKTSLFILGFIPLGMTPSLLSLNGVSFGIRGIFSSVGYAFIIAEGTALALDAFLRIKNKPLKYSAALAFFVIIMISFTYFSYIFFFRRPILVGELFNEHERKISQYIVNNQKLFQQKVYTNNKIHLYRSYVFFNNETDVISPQFYDCIQFKEQKEPNVIQIVSSECFSEGKYAQLIMNLTLKKIWYSDYSNKVAYFIFM